MAKHVPIADRRAGQAVRPHERRIDTEGFGDLRNFGVIGADDNSVGKPEFLGKDSCAGHEGQTADLTQILQLYTGASATSRNDDEHPLFSIHCRYPTWRRASRYPRTGQSYER